MQEDPFSPIIIKEALIHNNKIIIILLTMFLMHITSTSMGLLRIKFYQMEPTRMPLINSNSLIYKSLRLNRFKNS